MINYNFAVFILTHGRPDKVRTYKTLRNCGYTGKIYLLIDDQDKTIDEYRKLYKEEEIIVFSKEKAFDITPKLTNIKIMKAIVYARNYNFVIAENLKLDYFWQLDDDYKRIEYSSNDQNQYQTKNNVVKNLDNVLNVMIKFLIKSKVKTIAMAQSGDFIGGTKGTMGRLIGKNQFSRKAMNSFICSIKNQFKFIGEINEDVNSYTKLGNLGDLFITTPKLRIKQETTQQNGSGLTNTYKKLGTYVKSFFSVMLNPSSVKINQMGELRRLHHAVHWKTTVPEIISDSFKK